MSTFSCRPAAVATLVALIAGTACRAPADVPPETTTAPAVSAATPVAVERARADSTRYPWTAADVRFMTDMIGHHGQAITMSRMAPTHGASADIRRLAARIINAQQDEIAAMRRWLTDRRQPLPDTTMSHGAMSGMQHDAPMAGMLTPAQLRELDAARGQEFDRLFLTSMLQHHKGAMVMVQQLFTTPGAGQDDGVFKIANDIQADQGTEINRMTIMFLTLPGESQ